VVSDEGTKPDPGKVDAVVHFPVLKTFTNIKSFLGLTGYYRNYVQGYSRLVVPLFELTKKDVAFVWNSNCHQAFEALKRALVAAPVLVRPDFRKPFCLDHYNNRGLFCDPNIITNNKERSFRKPAVANHNSSQTLKLLRYHNIRTRTIASPSQLPNLIQS
jgi:hypothetical protein